MAYPWKPLHVGLAGTTVDTSEQEGGARLETVWNGRWLAQGRLGRRPGLTRRNFSSYDTDTNSTGSAPNLNWLAARGDVVLGVQQSTAKLYTLSPAAQLYYSVGTYSTGTVRELAAIGKQLAWNNVGTSASSFASQTLFTSYDLASGSSQTFGIGVYEDGHMVDTTTITGTDGLNIAVVHNSRIGVVFGTTGNTLVVRTWGSQPFTSASETTTTVGSDWVPSGALDAVSLPAGTDLFVGFKTTTANTVRLAKLTAGGTLTSTTFTMSNPITSVSVAASPTKVVICAVDNTDAAKIKIYSTALVDQSIDTTFTAALGSAGPRVALGCNVADTHCWVGYVPPSSAAPNASGQVDKRSLTTTTVTAIKSAAGAPLSHFFESQGRMYAWVSAWNGTISDFYNAVLGDYTDVSAFTPVAARIADAGSWGQMGHIYPSSGNTKRFSVGRWVVASVSSAPKLQAQLLEFENTRFPAWTQHGLNTYFSGSCPHYYDGVSVVEQNFHTTPVVTVATEAGSTSIANGSYTYQAVYRWVTANGEIERSAASAPFTVSLTNNGTQQLRVTVTCATTTSKVNAKQSIQIEVYRTDVNPTAGAPLYLDNTIPNSASSPSVNYVDSTVAATLVTQEILYTVGGVLDSEPASANGGVVSHDGRLWMLDDQRLWVSTQNDSRHVPAFSIFSAVDMPTAHGYSAALGAVSDKVVAFFDRGALVTGGGGLNALGVGPGYYSPQLVYVGKGPYAPVSCKSMAGVGVVFESAGRVMIMGSGLSPKMVSGPIQDFLPPEGQSFIFAQLDKFDELAVCGQGGYMCALNYRLAEWSIWEPSKTDAAPGALTRGLVATSGIWNLLNQNDGLVWQSVEDQLDDQGAANTNFTTQLETGWIRGTSSGTDWKGVRSVWLVGEHPSQGSHAIRVRVHFDDLEATTFPVDLSRDVALTGATTWPSDAYRLEFRMPRQKCNSLKLVVNLKSHSGSGAISDPRFSFLELHMIPRTSAGQTAFTA